MTLTRLLFTFLSLAPLIPKVFSVPRVLRESPERFEECFVYRGNLRQAILDPQPRICFYMNRYV